MISNVNSSRFTLEFHHNHRVLITFTNLYKVNSETVNSVNTTFRTSAIKHEGKSRSEKKIYILECINRYATDIPHPGMYV